MSNLRFIADQSSLLPDYFKGHDAISEFCVSERFAFLSDRFGYLNKFTRIRAASVSEGMFPIGNSIKSFDDIMLERAEYFANICLKENKKCYVMWSGGCDSTAILTAFLGCGYNLSFLKVLYTNSSVEEYKDFFELLQKNNISLELIHSYYLFPKAYELALEGNLVLTGFPADQLFGSIIGQNFPKDTTKIHWTEYLNKDIANQQYEAAFQYYGIPIKTVAEFLWFNNFVLKWDYVCYPALWMNNIHNDNIIPFYNTQDFEKWSVSNYDILHKYDQKDVKKYKIQMKEFIYKITNLNSVYNLKKVPSIGYAYEVDNNWYYKDSISCIDDEGNIYFANGCVTKEEKNNPTLLYKKYGLLSASILRKFLK